MTPDHLSDRLMAVAGMVSPGRTVYDVGCDHAYLSLYLVGHGIAEYAYACDINPGPLAAARRNIHETGFDGKAECMLSDGLHNIDKPIPGSTLIIAGMGGPLITGILRQDRDKLECFDEIIVSPQSLVEDTRRDLLSMGLYIDDEAFIYEDGKYYTIIRLVHRKTEYKCDIDGLRSIYHEYAMYKYGPVILRDRPAALKGYLIEEHGRLIAIRDSLDPDRHAPELQDVTIALHVNEIIMGGLYGYDQNRR